MSNIHILTAKDTMKGLEKKNMKMESGNEADELLMEEF